MDTTIMLYGFLSMEDPKDVIEFLEKITGEGTVCDVKVGQFKKESRAFAEVKFTNNKSVKTIMSLAAENCLQYDKDSYLKAHLHSMDDVTLHIGCQISKEKFSVLWKRRNILMAFGIGLKDLYLLFSYNSVEYKLEVPSKSIRQIKLRCPRGQAKKFLLIQVLAA